MYCALFFELAFIFHSVGLVLMKFMYCIQCLRIDEISGCLGQMDFIS